MVPSHLSHYAGWAAILSAATTILGLVTLLLFFSVGEPFGTINDVLSVVIALSAIVVLWTLHQLHRHQAWNKSLVALTIGVMALIVAAVLQTLLIVRVISFDQTAVTVPLAFGFFGLSFVIYGRLSLANPTMPRRLAILGIAAGVGYILVITGFIMGSQEHPLVAIGGLLTLVCYPTWATWFGRLFIKRKVSL